MARLPIPGQDSGTWGEVLNEYLSQIHNQDGSLKDGAITEDKLSTTVVTKLNTVAGQAGATGATGPQGLSGATGASGTPGTIGATGSSGPQGPAGTQGSPGATGATGPQGPQGNVGAQGASGTAGPAGSTGATGPSGPAGADGTSVTIAGSVADDTLLPSLGPGDAGEGYITEDDGHLHVWSGTAWSDVGEVRGPAGSMGATGPQGPSGAAGATGSSGPAGSVGATGATGPAGASDWEDITNKPPVVTSNTVEGLWKGTQIEYDALGTYDEDVLYFIEDAS